MPPTEPTGRLYQAFDPVPGNNSAAAPVGAPETTMQVNELNDTQRHDKAAISQLAEDVGLATNQHALVDQAIGWQPQNDVEFTGGQITGLTKAAVDPAFVPSNPDDLTDKAYVDALVVAAVGTGGLPIGTVVQWYGLAANVPQDWQICDGTNGTPDMSAKFARGAAVDGDIGSGGGSDTDTSSTAGDHGHTSAAVASHTLTESQIPGHVHASGGLSASSAGQHTHSLFEDVLNSTKVTTTGATAVERNAGGVADYRMSGGASANEPTLGRSSSETDHTHTISGNVASTGGSTGHTHGITVGTDGAHTHTVDTVPAYNYLYFIMRVS